ncbi:MAG: hypothetical protein JW855_03240 [Gammaproteobacteria bacterium]|nr:hypothetical protein [Gammaproteobacteria bacterium]
MINFIQIAFFISLLFGALLFLPQIIRLARTKNSEGVSLITFLGFTLIQLLVIIHGFYYQDSLLILGTFLRFLSCAILIYLILLYRFNQS